MSESSYGGSSYNSLPRTDQLVSGSTVLEEEEAASGAYASCRRAKAGMHLNSSPACCRGIKQKTDKVDVLLYSFILLFFG